MMTTNLFIIANVKQLRTDGSFRILLPFCRSSWVVGVLNSAIFNSFHNRVEFGTIFEGLLNFGGFWPPSVRHWQSGSFRLAQFWRDFGISGGSWTPKSPSVRHWQDSSVWHNFGGPSEFRGVWTPQTPSVRHWQLESLRLAQFWRAFGISGGGGWTPKPPSVRHWQSGSFHTKSCCTWSHDTQRHQQHSEPYN